ncbi:MAG TPA: response regulator [Anaerolineaceae bacterium]|nr:response regulator [Anaerolineaceae bacterium]
MGRILFIDDDLMTLELMQKETLILGYESIVSSSGGDALKMVSTQHPEMILVDFNLPDMSGLNFVRKARRLKEGFAIPIIVVSASNEIGKEEEVEQAGANGYISKPLGLDKLANVIKVYLKK